MRVIPLDYGSCLLDKQYSNRRTAALGSLAVQLEIDWALLVRPSLNQRTGDWQAVNCHTTQLVPRQDSLDELT